MDINSIVIGIVSGLITTFIIIILKYLYDKAIKPWYEKSIYKDISIEGQWIAKYKDDEYGKEIITINQSAHHIFGTIQTIDGEDRGNIYKFDGSFRNLILTLSYSSTNKYSIDRGTITLKVEDNGNKLVGYCSLFDDDSNNIKSEEYICKRKLK